MGTVGVPSSLGDMMLLITGLDSRSSLSSFQGSISTTKSIILFLNSIYTKENPLYFRSYKTHYNDKDQYSTASFMKTMNTIYLSHSTQVAGRTVFRKHTVSFMTQYFNKDENCIPSCVIIKAKMCFIVLCFVFCLCF